ncbi:hypothetical protein J2S58_003728 [Nakamurella flavida]|nr:hypothetical protein [Nakamurella flavida]MDP9780105.1 hypothetical protein [Nakamurella flavida]
MKIDTPRGDTRQVLDTDQVLRPASGIRIRPRPGGDLHIGSDTVHGLLLRDAPVEAAGVVAAATDGLPLSAWWRRERLDPDFWTPVFQQLLAAGLLVPATAGAIRPPGADLRGEHGFLTHRHGPAAAERALQARADALVVVQGSGPAAVAVAAQLAVAGVGHVHPRPDRSDRHRQGPGGDDEGRRLVALVRGASPTVRAHAPAAHVPPVLTVLVDGGPVDPGLAAELTQAGLPHLVLQVRTTRAVVGPLVLPGRTSCLLCADRHRADADPHWMIERPEPWAPPVPTVLVHAAAARAAHETLEFLDGLVAPATLDGTLEWTTAGAGPRRRTWRRHPDCGCGATGPGPSTAPGPR